jgi:hypothetical protein
MLYVSLVDKARRDLGIEARELETLREPPARSDGEAGL